MTSSLEPTLAFPPVSDLTGTETGRFEFEDGTVDLWSCSLEGDAAVLERCHVYLSEEERARSARFIRPEDRCRFTLAHGALRAVLGRYLKMDPGVLRFQAGPTGKPALLDHRGGPHALRFNLSHSHGRMLLAVANGQEVGIDLEQVRGNVEPLKLAERFYTQAEFESIKKLSDDDHAGQFYRLWVAKEAFLKAQGVGIPSLQQCEIVSSPALSRARVLPTAGSTMQHGWIVQWLSCGPEWLGAVAAYGNEWSVRVVDGMSV